MKKLLLSFYFLTFGLMVSAQSSYEKQMLQNIAQMKTATTVQNFTDLKNSFATLAGVGNTYWQPYYYTALSSLKEGEAYLRNGQTELAGDGPATAIKYLSPILAKEKNNAEINILLGFIHSFKARLKANEKDAKLAEDYMAAATKLDPLNPRLAILKAEFIYFSGDKAQGIELYKDAVKKFNTYKVKTKIDPDWGREIAENFAGLNQKALTLMTK